METARAIDVLIGQIAITRPPNVLRAVLGSCVGVAIYDEIVRIAALAHVLLPCSQGREESSLPGKYADIAVPAMIAELVRRGASRSRLRAKVAGGANLFGSLHTAAPEVGTMNCVAVRAALRSARVPLVWECLGGNCGVKVELSLESYNLDIMNFAKRNLDLGNLRKEA